MESTSAVPVPPSEREVLLHIQSLLSRQSTDIDSIETKTPSKKDFFPKMLEIFLSLSDGEELVKNAFAQQITLDNVIELWNSFVSDVQFEEFDAKCLKFFCSNYLKLSTDDQIKKMSFLTVLSVCKNEKITLEEDQIFSVINKWIKLTAPDDMSKQKLTAHVRLPLIQLKFLADDVQQSGLFSAEELLEAFTHQVSPKARTELRFQFRNNVIYVGINNETYDGYRKITDQDVKTKGFHNNLIHSLTKNEGRLEFIGSHIPSFRGLVTEKNFIVINHSVIAMKDSMEGIIDKKWACLEEKYIKDIHNQSLIFDTCSADESERYSFFVKKGVVFNH